MALELNLAVTVGYSKGGRVVSRSDSKQITIAGTTDAGGVQVIGTAEEAVVMTDVTAPGYVYLKNLDATNFIEIGGTTAVYDIKLLAGQFALFPLDGTTLFAKANTGACNLEKIIFSL